jgi:Leucine Rich Repeat
MSTTGPILPLELIEIVLDDLGDITSLKSCALVCRNWLLSTRRLLFHTVSLDYNKSDYKDLIDILESSSDIADCVRCLNLRGSDPSYLTSTGIGRACAKLFRVESLVLRIPYVDETIFTELLSSLSAVVRSAKSLSLECVRFENGDQIGRFIGAFPLLTELDLSNSGFTDTSITNPRVFKQLSPQTHRPRLRTLRMMQCYGDFSQQLIQASMLHLQHLTICTDSFNEIHPVLEATAIEALESLEIALFGSGSSTSGSSVLCYPKLQTGYNWVTIISDLCQFPSRLSNLRVFTAYTTVYDDHEHESMYWLYATLSNLPPTLVDIDLHIELEAGACQMINWENIESIIESRNLVSLRRVVLIFYLYGNGLQVVQELLIERLTKLKMSQSGILQIQF